jgi:hypothetical protein
MSATCTHRGCWPGELSSTQIEVLFKLPDLGPVEEGLLVFGPMPVGSYLTSVGVMDTDGTLDEAYGRLHRTRLDFEAD